jgi:opacity protein-like surface antigen
MISLRKAIVLGAALLAGSVSAASAADLGGYRGGSMKDGGYAPQAVQSAGPAWYFRLDTGVARHDNPYMVEDSSVDLTSTHMGKAWTLGGGVGYYFNKHVRGDLTYDHRFKANVSGNRFDAGQAGHVLAAGGIDPAYGCATNAAGVVVAGSSSCHGTREFGLKSDVFLANLYFDFDCRCAVTPPYLGAGLGVVHHKTTTGHVVDTHGAGVTGTIASGSSTHVAAALMAGFSFQVRERMNIDAGYRFLYLGETATGAVIDTASAKAIAPDPTVEQIHAHEFRVGLRYDFR